MNSARVPPDTKGGAFPTGNVHALPGSMDLGVEEDTGLGTLAIGDYLDVVRRRKWYLILTTIAVFAMVAIVARSIPAVYRASATILVEQQEVPADLVRTTVVSFADNRVRSISHRVLTNATLSDIIDRYSLYQDEDEPVPVDIAIEQLRSDVAVETDVDNNSTIAFTIAFQNRSPEVAKTVVEELVELYLAENLRKRREAARETSKFLGREGARLADEIDVLEVQFAQFKERHSDIIPEMRPANTRALEGAIADLDRNSAETRAAEQRLELLQAELARTSPFGDPGGENSGRVLSPRQQLLDLELRYAADSTRLQSNHPELVSLKRQIDTLRTMVDQRQGEDLVALLADEQARLAELLTRLSERHPDVISQQRVVDELSAQAQRAERIKITRFQNPVYLSLQERVREAKALLGSLRESRGRLQERRQQYEQRLEAGPSIEREYRILTRDYENSLNKYREVKSKQMEAELAESLEEERKSERLVLIEPPIVPSEAVKPDRQQILLAGLALAFGLGIGAAVVRELLDPGMYSERSIVAVTGIAPLSFIPYMETREEILARRGRLLLAAAIGIAVVVAAAYFVHLTVQPLDELGTQLLMLVATPFTTN